MTRRYVRVVALNDGREGGREGEKSLRRRSVETLGEFRIASRAFSAFFSRIGRTRDLYHVVQKAYP